MRPFDRLLTLPIQQLEALISEGLAAFRGHSRYRGVPPLEPSFGLIGEALLDRTFMLATHVLTGVPLPDTVRNMIEMVVEAEQFYGERGWLEEPRGYHLDPPPLETFALESTRAFPGPRPVPFEHLQFASGWAPHEGEPGRKRWVEHSSNGISHVHLLQHDEPRPWLVCIHGFGMGTPVINFNAFDIHHLHHELGLNLAFPVLPLHGPRTTASFSGGEVLSPDYMQMVHLFAQATWDVRRLIPWLRTRGTGQIGLYGISLGGYVSALVASLEAELDAVIAGVPAVDFPSLARDNQPWIMRRYDDEFDFDWSRIRAATHVVSPLALTPLVPRERRFIFAGIADRVVKPDQARALWRHWDEPEIHWFSGGHLLGIRNRSAVAFRDRCLQQTGLTS